ncbi:MAG TPA: hypothetical protein VMJ66_09115 [Geobacteraceae bacterium]|nr:hypothetical protein [Geobacteraceae bacterium]
MEIELICEHCGKRTVEKGATGLYCTSCQREVVEQGRAVHHEGFPHVVSDEEEQ